jgi:hypothetical protein
MYIQGCFPDDRIRLLKSYSEKTPLAIRRGALVMRGSSVLPTLNNQTQLCGPQLSTSHVLHVLDVLHDCDARDARNVLKWLSMVTKILDDNAYKTP